MTAISEKRKGSGKPFPKGVSANPTGRPKQTSEELNLIAACKEKTPQALNTIIDIMENGQSEKTRLSSAQYIIDRAYGKAIQTTEVTGKNGGNILQSITVSFVGTEK